MFGISWKFEGFSEILPLIPHNDSNPNPLNMKYRYRFQKFENRSQF